MNKNNQKALSEVEYLKLKLDELEDEILNAESNQLKNDKDLRNMYYEKGKMYSKIELLKRVPSYE